MHTAYLAMRGRALAQRFWLGRAVAPISFRYQRVAVRKVLCQLGFVFYVNHVVLVCFNPRFYDMDILQSVVDVAVPFESLNIHQTA